MTQDKASEKQHLIVIGDVTQGFEFIGPFPTLADAVEWARDNTDRIGTDWTTAPLTDPFTPAVAGTAPAEIRLSA